MAVFKKPQCHWLSLVNSRWRSHVKVNVKVICSKPASCNRKRLEENDAHSVFGVSAFDAIISIKQVLLNVQCSIKLPLCIVRDTKMRLGFRKGFAGFRKSHTVLITWIDKVSRKLRESRVSSPCPARYVIRSQTLLCGLDIELNPQWHCDDHKPSHRVLLHITLLTSFHIWLCLWNTAFNTVTK